MTRRVLAALALTGLMSWTVIPAEPAKPADDPSSLRNETILKQQTLARQFKEFKDALLRMAQRLEKSSRKEDRDKAASLRKAINIAQEQGADLQFSKLVGLLMSKDGLTTREIEAAIGENDQLIITLRKILEAITADDEDKQRKDEQKRLTELLKELDKVIRAQKLERAKVESGKGDKDSLAKGQEKVNQDTNELAKSMSGKKGDPKDSKDNKSAKGDPKDSKGDPKDSKGDPKDSKSAKGDPKDSKGDPKDSKSAKGDPKDSKGDPKDSKGDPKDTKSAKGDPKDSKGDPKDSKSDPKDSKSAKGDPKSGDPKSGDPKSGDSKSQDQQANNQQQPESPGKKKVQEAQEAQEQAKKKIEEDKRDEASAKQDDAIKKLEEARKELERRLKQLREEELERVLADLKSRCQRMLTMQIEVYEGTKRVDSAIQGRNGKTERDDEQEALRLADREREIVLEAEKALRLLAEEGTAVAFPKFFEDARDDMIVVRNRLEKADVSAFTQRVEEDIIATLKEMLEALDKAQKDLKQQQQSPPPGGGGGQPPDQKLLDTIAELKMVRSMQAKINSRTAAYGAKSGGEQTNDPLIQKELRDLSERQAKLERIIKDLVQGKNK